MHIFKPCKHGTTNTKTLTAKISITRNNGLKIKEISLAVIKGMAYISSYPAPSHAACFKIGDAKV